MNIVSFAVSFFVIAALIFAASYAADRLLTGNSPLRFSTREITVLGLFAALGVLLTLFEIPLPFAPSFYKLDFSDLPVLITAFMYGPFAGVLCELVKVLLKLLLKGTTSAFVGAAANFIIGSLFAAPAAIVYGLHKSKKQAVLACAAGTVSMTLAGSLFNAFFLLPTYAVLYGMPLEVIVGMGTKLNPAITSVGTLVLFAVVPFNLLKGGLISLLTILVYKYISRVIKA